MATTVALTGSNQLVKSTGAYAKYRGYTIRETAGSTAVVRIWDNTSAAGTLLDDVSLNPNESAREWYAGDGISVAIGVFVQVVSGTVAGSVRVD